MNTIPKRTYRRWILGLLPIAIIIAAVLLNLANEFIASIQIKQQLQAVRESGFPVDSFDLMNEYESRTSKTQTTAWQELTVSTSQLSNAANDAGIWWSYNPEKDDELDLPVKENWPQAARFESFLKDAQPILSRMNELSRDVQPTWQPLLAKSESGAFYLSLMTRLTAHEFRYAVYVKDSERALRALRCENAALVAYDWQSSLDEQRERGRILQTQSKRLRQSLSRDLWTTEQLEWIAGSLNHSDNETSRWRNLAASAQVRFLESIKIASGQLYTQVPNPFNSRAVNANWTVPASNQLAMLRTSSEETAAIQQRIGSEFPDPSRAMAVWRTPPSFVAKVFGPNLVPMENYQDLESLRPDLSGMVKEMQQTENARRFTQTAIAIKRFQLTNQRFPTSLDELSTIGLSIADTKRVDGESFSFVLVDELGEAIIRTTDLESCAIR